MTDKRVSSYQLIFQIRNSGGSDKQLAEKFQLKEAAVKRLRKTKPKFLTV